MEEFIYFRTNDFLQNAGIVGLIRLLEFLEAEENEDYFIENSELKITRNYLLKIDLAQAYMDVFINKYYEDTQHAAVMGKIEYLEQLSKTDDFLSNKEQKKKVDEQFTFVRDKLLSASYKSGYDILKNEGKDWNVLELLKIIKDEPDYSEKMKHLADLKLLLNQNEMKETLAFKSIIYSRINMFWENKAFLYPQNSKKNMKETLEKDFTNPLYDFVNRDKSKSKDYCIACGESMGTKDKVSIAFMKDLSDDLARKKSAFWNFKVDAYICPCCALLYAFVPLGFVPMGPDMVFVNTNSNIKFLMQSNPVNNLTSDDTENEKWRVLYNKILQNQLKATKKRISNIQVVVRKKYEERYNLNIIGKDVLGIMNLCKNSLENLIKWASVKERDNYINVYDSAVENIINHRNQYLLIGRLFKISVEQSSVLGCIHPLISIQRVQSESKIRNGGIIVNKKMLYYACKGGDQLRNKISKDFNVDETDNKLRGVTFKFLNTLQVGDQFGFMNMLLRLCTSYNMEVPSVFMSVFDSEEEFLSVAYSFLLGLKGGFYKKDSEKSETDENAQDIESKMEVLS